MAQPRWPNGAKAAVSFTMDNLGEAQDVNKGLWPSNEPIGQHYSVVEKLPRMLDMLDQRGIKATYFAESWSLAVYPNAVKELTRREHEVAWHGYQHEAWKALSEEEEVRNFDKSFKAAEGFGITYQGFRPPSGSVNQRTYELLRRHKVDYISPLGELGIKRGVVVLPFEWKGVDAFYYMEKFAPIREAHGEQSEALSPHAFKAFLLSRIQRAIEEGGYVAVLFHPFLQTSEEKFAVLGEVLDAISGNPEIWCAPCKVVSNWIREHPKHFATRDS